MFNLLCTYYVSVLTLMMTSAKVVKINSGLAWSLLLLTTIFLITMVKML